MRSSWAGPRPFALLRAGVRLSRGPLRCRAAHHSRWSCPFHPSRIPPMLQLLSAMTALRSGPPHFAPYANAAPRSSLLTSLFTQLAMAPVAAFGRPTLPQTTRTRPAQFRCVGCALLRRLRSIRPAHPPLILQLQGPATCRPAHPQPARRVRPQSHDTPATGFNASPPRGPLPDGQPAAPPPTPPHRRQAAPGQKRPHAARQHPLIRLQAAGRKRPATRH